MKYTISDCYKYIMPSSWKIADTGKIPALWYLQHSEHPKAASSITSKNRGISIYLTDNNFSV